LIQKRLASIDAELIEADPVTHLQLAQERLDLQTDLAAADRAVDLFELEAAFVASARSYGERQGISYAAWREIGVPSAVLKAAGISRRG
jgi:hypothetical protein